MKRFALTFGAIVFCAMCSHAALADSFSFSFSGSDFSGSGTFTTSAGSPGPGGSTEYSVTGITGTVTPHFGSSTSITGLNTTFDSPDNLIFDPGIFGTYELDSNGVSFNLANGGKVNLSASWFSYIADSTKWSDDPERITFTLCDPPTDPPAAPEPNSLALLGTGILGAAGMIRRRRTR